MNLFNFHHHTLGNFYGIYNLELGENVPESYFSVGIHPKDIDENWQKHFEAFKKISLQDNCLAIGECGLDALIDIDANLQKTVFERQILLANEIQKPVIIHCVKWFQELIPFQKLAEVPLIIHGFNKRKSVTDEMLKHGFFLSFGKSVLYNLSLQSILKEIPIDKFFLETDDTDFDIAELYQKVSEIKEISLEELQKKISENLQSINVKF